MILGNKHVCINCGDDSAFHEMSHDIVCTLCGCEQKLGPEFVTSYDTSSHVEEMQKQIKVYKGEQEAYDMVQRVLRLPDGIIETARKMLRDYMKVTGIIKCQDKTKYALATCYYACRTSSALIIRKRFEYACGVHVDCFSKTCKDIKTSLANSIEWKAAFAKKRVDDYISIALPIIAKLELPKADVREILRKIHKIYIRVAVEPSFQALHPSTMATGLVSVASKACKLYNINLTKIHASSNVAMASIINAENEITTLLLRSK